MSDYTPPTLVIPTPGGNPGDGSLNGDLTTQANTTTPQVVGTGFTSTNGLGTDSSAITTTGTSGAIMGMYIEDGYPICDIEGKPSPSSTQGLKFRLDLRGGNGSALPGMPTSAAVQWYIMGAVNQFSKFVSIACDNEGNFGSNGKYLCYAGIATAGMGIPPLYGDDARTGLTAVDSAAKTLYTTTAAGQLYRLMGRILATAGTSPSATYTIKWTEGGATITKTLTISALDSDSDLSILIQPDNGTDITAQLTAISGTGTTVNVAATVEQMA